MIVDLKTSCMFCSGTVLFICQCMRTFKGLFIEPTCLKYINRKAFEGWHKMLIAWIYSYFFFWNSIIMTSSPTFKEFLKTFLLSIFWCTKTEACDWDETIFWSYTMTHVCTLNLSVMRNLVRPYNKVVQCYHWHWFWYRHVLLY